MGTPRTPDLSKKPNALAWLTAHQGTSKLAKKIIDFLEPHRVNGFAYGWYDKKEYPAFTYGEGNGSERVSIHCLVDGCNVTVTLQESLLPKELQGTGSVAKDGYKTTIPFSNVGDNAENFDLLLKVIKTNQLKTLIYKGSEHQDSDELSNVVNDKTLNATQRKALIEARLGQGKFREDLLDYWKQNCAITKCDFKPLLKASHIKPWKVADNFERLDKYNGLLLSANLDALFDNGYISFENDGRIIFSKELPQALSSSLGISSATKINVENQHSPYLEFHRNQVLR